MTNPPTDPPAEATVEVEVLEDAGAATTGDDPAADASTGRRGAGPAFWLAVAWLAVVAFCAIFVDLLPLPSPDLPQPGSGRLASPDATNPLGTDGISRDIATRLIHGARVSLVVSLTAVGIGLVVGGTLGMMVGYFRGWFETVVMRIIDIILAFPGLVLLLVLLAYLGSNLRVISIIIGVLSIPIYTRVARANTLALSQREFVRTARTMGASHRRIIFRELLPNVVLPVAAFGLVAAGVVIVLEGSLAFLGLSVPPPRATWGGMIAAARRDLSDAPWVALFPSLAMFFTVLSLNFVGDTLRTRFDVKDSRL